MYTGFFAMAVLSLLPVAHGAYRIRKVWKRMPRRAKTFLTVLAVLYGCAVTAGVVVVLIGAEPTASHCMGLIALVLSLWIDERCKRVGDDPGHGEV